MPAGPCRMLQILDFIMYCTGTAVPLTVLFTVILQWYLQQHLYHHIHGHIYQSSGLQAASIDNVSYSGFGVEVGGWGGVYQD